MPCFRVTLASGLQTHWQLPKHTRAFLRTLPVPVMAQMAGDLENTVGSCPGNRAPCRERPSITSGYIHRQAGNRPPTTRGRYRQRDWLASPCVCLASQHRASATPALQSVCRKPFHHWRQQRREHTVKSGVPNPNQTPDTKPGYRNIPTQGNDTSEGQSPCHCWCNGGAANPCHRACYPGLPPHPGGVCLWGVYPPSWLTGSRFPAYR